jgi:hypothetical protein
MFEFLNQTIKNLEENRELLLGKFNRGKRLHIIADHLQGAFRPPVWPKGHEPAGDQAKRVSDFYAILSELDRKFEFTGAMPDRFVKIYNAYLAQLKKIVKELTGPAKES